MASLLLTLLLGASLVKAGGATHPGCEERDYRGDLGPPRMQDGTSWCYANSAADLISQAVHERVSAIDLATTYLLADERKLEKLNEEPVTDYLLHHPDFEDHLRETRKEDEAYQPDHILSADGMVDTGGRDDEAIVLSNLKGLCLASHLPSGEENLNKYLEAIRDDYLKDKDPDLSPGPIGGVENDVAKIMARSFQRWVDLKCGKRYHPHFPLLPREVAVADSLDEFKHLVSSGKLSPDEARATLTTELDHVLDSGKVAAIAYESYDLYPLSAGKPGNTHGDHSSVVAARKWVDGRCRYFVRNHFGPTCGYRTELDGHCEKEDGGVWVTLDALNHLYSVISVR